jgi:hypothetical protein
VLALMLSKARVHLDGERGEQMKHKVTLLLTTILQFGIATGCATNNATVCGVARDLQGRAVTGATIMAKDSNGRIVGQSTTGADGTYSIDRVNQGKLNLALDSGNSSVPAGSGVVELTSASEAVDWQVASSGQATPAITNAQCADPPGPLTSTEWIAIGALGAAAIIGAGVLACGLARCWTGNHH